MADTVRYSDSVTIRLQEGATAFVHAKAREIGTKPAEIARQALLQGLKGLGFEPKDFPNRDAGTLYDVVDGKQRYALIEDGQIHNMSYCAEPPSDGRQWLPVRHRDSEPFDRAAHWRLQPVATIEAHYVVQTYPVVLKSLEQA